MLEQATSFIENDMVEAALRTLNRALLSCDGEPQPPDFIQSEGVPQLRRMIEYLMGYLTDDDGDGLSEHQGDCNDTDNTIYPGAPEVCDSQDNQCPGDSGYGTVDEGCLTDVLVGVGSIYECRNQSYWVQFRAFETEHVADTINVTGPGIDGSQALTYYGPSDGWGTDSLNYLGQEPPAPPPLTYTFHIESNGTIYPMDFILQSFNEECATNLSTSGDLTFTWTSVSFLDAVYVVYLDESGMYIWVSPEATTNFIDYDGPALSSGLRYVFEVHTRDSFGNFSVTQADFVYEPSPP